jgi:hypothetical protein
MKTLALCCAVSLTLFSGPGPSDRQREIDEHFKVTPAQRIEIQGFSGSDIKFRSWDNSEVYVKLSISISTSSEKDEQRYLEGVRLRKSETTQSMVITFEEPSFMSRSHYSFWSWLESIFSGSATSKRIEGEIFVPRANPLTAEVRYGSVSLDGMKGPLNVRGTSNRVTLMNCSAVEEIANDFGNITIERSGGSLQLSTKSSTVMLDQFTGNATIDADYSTITVKDVTQSLTLNSKSATIRVDRVGGSAQIRSDYSKITANDIGGMMEIDDQSGSIRARHVGGANVHALYSTIEISGVTGKGGKDITIVGQSGQVSLLDATGNAKVENPYGNTEINNLRGNVFAESKSSRVDADGIQGDWISHTEYCTVWVRDLTAKHVTMTNKSGKIDISLKAIPSLTNIRNEYADVNVEIPGGFSGNVDLDCTYGKIESNIPHIKDRVIRETGGYHLRFEGDGKTKLIVEATSGNVRVMQR